MQGSPDSWRLGLQEGQAVGEGGNAASVGGRGSGRPSQRSPCPIPGRPLVLPPITATRHPCVLPHTNGHRTQTAHVLHCLYRRVQVRKWSDPVDNGANLLIPVPGGADGPGGVLVCAENFIIYKNQDHEEVGVEGIMRKLGGSRWGQDGQGGAAWSGIAGRLQSVHVAANMAHSHQGQCTPNADSCCHCIARHTHRCVR